MRRLLLPFGVGSVLFVVALVLLLPAGASCQLGCNYPYYDARLWGTGDRVCVRHTTYCYTSEYLAMVYESGGPPFEGCVLGSATPTPTPAPTLTPTPTPAPVVHLCRWKAVHGADYASCSFVEHGITSLGTGGLCGMAEEVVITPSQGFEWSGLCVGRANYLGRGYSGAEFRLYPMPHTTPTLAFDAIIGSIESGGSAWKQRISLNGYVTETSILTLSIRQSGVFTAWASTWHYPPSWCWRDDCPLRYENYFVFWTDGGSATPTPTPVSTPTWYWYGPLITGTLPLTTTHPVTTGISIDVGISQCLLLVPGGFLTDAWSTLVGLADSVLPLPENTDADIPDVRVCLVPTVVRAYFFGYDWAFVMLPAGLGLLAGALFMILRQGA